MDYLKSIPQELIQYKKTEEDTIEAGNFISLALRTEINRDSRGRIASVNLYSVDNELYKQIFFDRDYISAINYYKNKKLSHKEFFERGYVSSKYVYKQDGNLAYEIYYTYDNCGKITCIRKKNGSKEAIIKYDYDSIDRIISRKIYLDSCLITKQYFRYDALNRVIEYKDENLRIVVKSISKKNELLSYTITDKINNEVLVTNYFTESGYIETKFTLNGHTTTVKNTNYVDNIMLKRPFTSEHDLDLIISSLYNSSASQINKLDKESARCKNSMGIVNPNIEMKTLPISIRKRVLYNIAMQARA